jgi:hypothetical protein
MRYVQCAMSREMFMYNINFFFELKFLSFPSERIDLLTKRGSKYSLELFKNGISKNMDLKNIGFEVCGK